MSAKGTGRGKSNSTQRYRGWQLVETAHGWFAEKGPDRVRVGWSTEDHSNELDARMRRIVDEREDGR